jgi:hypothetical protein
MKILLMLFAVCVFSMAPAFACDEQGSAEDCPDFHSEPGHVTFCTPDGICCDYNGCSGTWLRSLPVMTEPVADVPLPAPDFSEPVSDLPRSNVAKRVYTQSKS